MQKKSIYTYAAESGVPAGLYLTLMSFCLLFSVKLPNTILLLLPLAIGFPVFLWVMMKNIVKKEPGYMKFSSLWLGGIYTVIFGTLICMLLSSLYIVFIEPGFVQLYVMNTVEALEISPFATEYETSIALMKEAMEAHILPSGLEFLMTMAWFTCFTGSLLSLVIALLISRGRRKVSSEISAR